MAGYVPERSLPKKAVKKAANKKKNVFQPNSMIGRFTVVFGTTVMRTSFLL